jgi:hypothetical protein
MLIYTETAHRGSVGGGEMGFQASQSQPARESGSVVAFDLGVKTLAVASMSKTVSTISVASKAIGGIINN